MRRIVFISLLFCASSFASSYGGGLGTLADPYQIWTAAQMNQIGLNQDDWDDHFILMDDIDLSAYTGTQFNMIGYISSDWMTLIPFSGSFNGNYHVIDNFTYTQTASEVGVAMFLYTSQAIIENLGLENVNINVTATGSESDAEVAILVRYADQSSIYNCYAKGDIDAASLSGEVNVGGIVCDGWSSSISRCYTEGDFMCNAIEVDAGGICEDFGSLSNCYSLVNITVVASDSARVGGLCPEMEGGECYKSYYAGILSVSSPDTLQGGLIGDLYGWEGSDAEISSCVWDMNVSGQSEAFGASQGIVITDVIGLTTAQMKDVSNYTSIGWDFVGETLNGTADIWDIPDGGGYPILIWNNEPICVNKPLSDLTNDCQVTIADFAIMASEWLSCGYENSLDCY